MGKVYLKPKEEKRILAGHLWIFNNEIASLEGIKENGELVEIYSWGQKFLGLGYYNRHSLISVRVLSYQREEVDGKFFGNRIKPALAYRTEIHPGTNSLRLIYSEGDFLPGLIVDKYGDYLVVQILTLGMEKLTELIVDTLAKLVQPKGILLRNDSPIREREGLGMEVKVVFGEVPERTVIEENGLKIEVDLKGGQKTGFFFDQKENRKMVQGLAKGRRALDAFCYSGGFGLNALLGGAESVLALDESKEALELARVNAELNHFDQNFQTLEAGALSALRELQERKEMFDLIILDPPAFVKSKEKLGEGRKGYKEINLSAMKLLSSNGILVTCSCSYQLSSEDFMQTLRAAARDARRHFRLRSLTTQAPDHPIRLAMPETEYLKCAVLEACL